MQQYELELVISHFNLGTLQAKPEKVTGGLLHQMWRIQTSSGTYAIKQLSKKIDLNNHNIIKNYELTEDIASCFISHGIPAVCALQKSGNSLFINNNRGFLIYPWVDHARTLDSQMLWPTQALKIAALLAKMHCINLDKPAEFQQFSTHSKDYILALIDKTQVYQCSFAAELYCHRQHLLNAHNQLQKAAPFLATNTVVSHGDLDQKNVLWDNYDNPVIIDWESACKINPTYDIINTAFYWSGITNKFDKALFINMVDEYHNAGGNIDLKNIDMACYGTLNWINWLIYNMERAYTANDPEEKAIASAQVTQTLATIIQLQIIIPQMIKYLKKSIH